MLTKRHIFLAILATGLTVGSVSTAAAQGHNSSSRHHAAKSHTSAQYQQARPRYKQKNIATIDRRNDAYRLDAQSSVSPAEAKSIARSRIKGSKFVDISRRGDTYRVRVIAKNNKVVDVYIDANTGRVKKVT